MMQNVLQIKEESFQQCIIVDGYLEAYVESKGH